MEPGSSPAGGGAGRMAPAPAAGRGEGLEVEVVLQDTGWRRLLPGAEALARRAVHAALRDTAGHGGTITVLLAGDRELRRLNGEHRGKDKPTNVLSFPADLPEGLPPGVRLPLLGDLVICAPVVAREAAAQGKRPNDHYAHLTVHGALHLLGWDHENEADAEAMESLERQVLAGLGIADPY